jgi:hypothetical protein
MGYAWCRVEKRGVVGWLQLDLEVLDGSSDEADHEMERGDHCVKDLVCHSIDYS